MLIFVFVSHEPIAIPNQAEEGKGMEKQFLENNGNTPRPIYNFSLKKVLFKLMNFFYC